MSKNTEKKILDACCGGRMFWFDKHHPSALYIDERILKRQVIWQSADEKRMFEVKPDMVMDFRKMSFKSASFKLVVFDPPHLMKRNGKTGWMNKKYGSLNHDTWTEDLRQGFAECFRVLKKDGILIFKWSETEIPLRDVLPLAPYPPLFGHPSGKSQRTHWITFMKI